VRASVIPSVTAAVDAVDDLQSLLLIPELSSQILSRIQDEILAEIECCADIADTMGRPDIGARIRSLRTENLSKTSIIH
jgi:hypothetical protein